MCRRIQRIDLHRKFLDNRVINRFTLEFLALQISSARNLRVILSFENYLKSPTSSLSLPPVLIFVRFAFSLSPPPPPLSVLFYVYRGEYR